MDFDGEFDVIVAGTGAAGGGAVMGALDSGAKSILVCEKSQDQYGGTTDNSGLGWMWVPNNRFLKELGVNQDPEEIVALLKDLAEKSSKGHKVDEGDLELMKAFAYDWPPVMEQIEKKGYLILKVEDAREEEDEAKLEELYKLKMKKNPEAFKKIGITAETVQTLKKFLPSYCAENDLDFCPTGKAVSCMGKSTSGFIQKTIADHKDIITLKDGHQVVDLIFSPDNKRVIGAVVKDTRSDKLLRFKAKKGVVFGSGGFSFNKEYMKEYFKAEFHGSCAGSENKGDLVTIAKRHNIKLAGMDEAWFKQVVIPEHDDRYPGVFFINADSFMIVNKHGRRFANEKDYYQERGLQMVKNQEECRVVVAIYDERSAELHQGPILSLGGPVPFEHATEGAVVTGKDFKELTQNVQNLIDQHVQNFKLDANFAATVEKETKKFNSYAKTGVDKDFHRGEMTSKYCWHTPRRDNEYPNKTMHPIDISNLRALVLGLSTLDTRGGPRTNKFGQIYKDISKKELIPGLYGAGNCVKAFAKYSYPASGVTIASAMFFGYQAGTHAMTNTSQVSRL